MIGAYGWCGVGLRDGMGQYPSDSSCQILDSARKTQCSFDLCLAFRGRLYAGTVLHCMF